ncbi:hypothetical protein JZ751_026948, partial [Albula glossodonta]
MTVGGVWGGGTQRHADKMGEEVDPSLCACVVAGAMVLEGSSEALCPPPSLELRSPCSKSQPAPPLGSITHPHQGLYPGDKEPVKYGDLIVLGYNGSLANGDKGRRRSRLALYKRPKANGVKPDVIHNISTPLVSKALSNKSQHSISYTLSRSHSVIVEYTHDSSMDMFQIGRSTESMIDFVVTDTSPSGQGGVGGEGGQSAQSTISRYACRILCERSPPYTTRIYAAGFDSSKNIFLGNQTPLKQYSSHGRVNILAWLECAATPPPLPRVKHKLNLAIAIVALCIPANGTAWGQTQRSLVPCIGVEGCARLKRSAACVNQRDAETRYLRRDTSCRMPQIPARNMCVRYSRGDCAPWVGCAEFPVSLTMCPHGWVSQERAAKWRTSDGLMDGLTTNGVLVMHPAAEFVGEPAPGVWREISVCGNVYALRETRSAQQRGKLVENESNTLQDGSLIDLCGATLLWRTPAGLRRTPTLKQLESLRQELNAARPQCPVGFNTLAFPSLAQRQTVDKKQPWVYVNCGHVHGYHNWGFRRERGSGGGAGGGGVAGGGAGGAGGSLATTGDRECPMCRRIGPYVPLWLGCEGGFYLDEGPPTHAFCPCGHVCSEKTVQGWSQVPLPHGTHAFHAACPFCGTWLTGENGYIKLIFQ